MPSTGAGTVIIFIGLYLYKRQIATRRIEKVDNTHFRYKIDDLGIHYDNEMGSGLIKWGFKGKLLPNKEFILLQSPEMGPIPIPLNTPSDVIAHTKDKLRPHSKS